MNILIVEDEQIIRDYIKMTLLEYKDVVAVISVDEAIEQLEQRNFNIILSDILMDDKTGFDLLQYVNDNNIDTPVVMISALNDENSLIKAYDLGAIDYITKPINKEILKMKIKNLSKYISNQMEGLTVDEKKREVYVEGEEIELTKIEYDMFMILYKNSPRIYTKDNFIDLVWNSNYAMSEKIIEVNIFNIRKKLKQYSKILKTKRKVGYYIEN